MILLGCINSTSIYTNFNTLPNDQYYVSNSISDGSTWWILFYGTQSGWFEIGSFGNVTCNSKFH